MADARIPDVARIAVLRANAIGDLMFSLPALDALRAAYPGAEITLLGAPWHVDFLRHRPSPVDRCLAVPASEGVWLPAGAEESPDELESFFAQAKEERYDVAVQLHGGGRFSNPFVSRLGARVTVGMRADDAPALDRWVRYVYYHPEVLRYLEVMRLVGAEPVTLEARVNITGADRAEADALLAEMGMGAGQPFAVLNPGATDPRRRWPVPQWAEVGDALARAGASVLVSGDGTDVGRADAVVSAMRAPGRAVAGRLSLGGLVGLLDRAAVVVSNDSGPLHLARAVGTATVGIYWAGNMINGGPVTAHRHRSACSWHVCCPVCGQDNTVARCPHDPSFVADVPVSQVEAAAVELFSMARPDSRPAEPGFSRLPGPGPRPTPGGPPPPAGTSGRWPTGPRPRPG
jgi:ADP-heptose:LPS heptosyltransferase